MNIKAKREQAGLTQKELADVLRIHQTTVGKWETAGIHPKGELLPRIAEVLNCTIDELYGKEE